MKNQWEDRATTIRPGEELQLKKLESFLKNEIPRLEGSLEIQQFPKGFSNLTYLLKFENHEFVLRRAPFGANIKSGHDMSREYKILKGLSDIYDKTPKPWLYTKDDSIIGTPFYIMDRVSGVILRAQMPSEMVPEPELMHRISDSFLETLVELHGLDYRAADLQDLGNPAGYVERQIIGWSRRYEKAKTNQQDAMEQVIRWLHEHMPEESGSSLIHNDFKYDNLVLDSSDWSKVIAVLDWEMSTLGDPLMDLGTSLAYWINVDDPDWLKMLALSPTTIEGNPKRSEIATKYAVLSGRDVSNIVYYYVYGIFKVAVIAQQIFFRYSKGLTRDKRFANLDKVVEGLGIAASLAIQKNRIDQLF